MADDKIVLGTSPSDQGDIIKDFIEWHLDLGVDRILALDCNSSDNTQEVLNSFSSTGQVQWSPRPGRHYLNYSSAETMAKSAREEHAADWLMICDADEFLCPLGDDLRTILKRAAANDVTAINVPCFNMMGVPSAVGRATYTHTLRIDQPVRESGEQQLTGDIPVPYIFIRHPPKTIVRTAAFLKYGWGAHEVNTTWGRTEESSELRFLHFPIRGFDKFQQKVKNVTAFFEENTHFEKWWGWHWRRWIRLDEEGRLREEYENQFASPDHAENLIREGICVIDKTIHNWIAAKTDTYLAK